MKTGSTKVVRCAIYTRVSTDQGLEQDFNSLDAQYEASQAYIRSTKRTPAGRCYEPNTTTAASPAATLTGRPCSGSSRTCGQARST